MASRILRMVGVVVCIGIGLGLLVVTQIAVAASDAVVFQFLAYLIAFVRGSGS